MASVKEATVKKEEKLAELLKEAEDSPILKQLRAEKAAAILTTRTEAAGKIEALKKEREEVIPQLIEDRAAKEEKFKRAKAALDAAGSEYQTARLALSSRSQSFEHAIGRQEMILLESTDPALGEAITFFREKLDWLRTPGRINQNAVGAIRNVFTEKKTTRRESNLEAINSAMAYCRAAIMELESMKLAPALDAERIEGLKAGIPSIDVYTEYTGEKPMAKVPPTFFPGTAYQDELTERLLRRRV